MVYVEVRGGVVVAVYSDDIKNAFIIDHDENAVLSCHIDPVALIPEAVSAFMEINIPCHNE